MNFEKLYHLIHFFSKDQKNRFSRFMRGRTKTDYYLLYRRIAKASDPKENSERIVRGKEFKSDQKYYQYKKELTKLLIESQVSQEHSEVCNLAFVKTGFMLNMREVALEALFCEMLRIQNVENFHLLRYYFQFIERLNLDFGIEIEIPKWIKSEEYCCNQIAENIRLKQVLERVRASAKLPISDRNAVLMMELKTLKGGCGCKVNRNIVRKILMVCALMVGDYDRAYYWGESLVKHLLDFPERYSVSFVAKEMTKISMNALLLGNRDQAVNMSIRTASLEVESPFEQAIINKQLIRIESAIAVTFSDERMAESCLDRLNVAMFVLDPEFAAFRYFYVGLTFFRNENYCAAIPCFEFIRENRSKNSKHFLWEPQMLLAISYFKVGDIDESERIIRSVSPRISKVPGSFASFSLKTFRAYLNSTSSDQLLLVQNAINQLEKILEDPEEKRRSLMFPFSTWLRSILTGISQKQILESESSARKIKAPKFNIN